MNTLEQLRHRIVSVEDMQSVVSTMMTLSAARIRQYERAADATKRYVEVVHRALQVLLQNSAARQPLEQTLTAETRGLILIGSDQGFCGRFNELVVESALASMDDKLATTSSQPRPQDALPPKSKVLAVGQRIGRLLEDLPLTAGRVLEVPKSVPGIAELVQQLIPLIQSWLADDGVEQIELWYNYRLSAANYQTRRQVLMPLPSELIGQLQNREWPSRGRPVIAGNWEENFRATIRQYLFIRLFRAISESLASENASRIAAMQQAERNIEQKLSELNVQYNQQRQRQITEELLEILSGAEATQ